MEPPYVIAGQIATIYYFAHFLIILPLFGIIDNVLSLLGINANGSLINELTSNNKILNFDKLNMSNKLNKFDKLSNNKSHKEELEVLLDSIPSNPIAT